MMSMSGVRDRECDFLGKFRLKWLCMPSGWPGLAWVKALLSSGGRFMKQTPSSMTVSQINNERQIHDFDTTFVFNISAKHT